MPQRPATKARDILQGGIDEGSEHMMMEAEKAPLLSRLGRYLREFCRPQYHIRKFLEDLRSARMSLQQKDIFCHQNDPARLAQAIRGRLFATYVMTGLFTWIGLAIGQTTQYVAKNAALGYVVTVLLANVISTLAFQAIWMAFHRSWYVRGTRNPFVAIWRMWHDILPIQWRGVLWVLPILLLIMPVVLGLERLMELFGRDFAIAVPYSLIGAGLEVFVQNVTLIRLLGDIFERQSQKIAERHLAERELA
jgi:hypothetical protein